MAEKSFWTRHAFLMYCIVQRISLKCPSERIEGNFKGVQKPSTTTLYVHIVQHELRFIFSESKISNL